MGCPSDKYTIGNFQVSRVQPAGTAEVRQLAAAAQPPHAFFFSYPSDLSLSAYSMLGEGSRGKAKESRSVGRSLATMEQGEIALTLRGAVLHITVSLHTSLTRSHHRLSQPLSHLTHSVWKCCTIERPSRASAACSVQRALVLDAPAHNPHCPLYPPTHFPPKY